MLAVQRGKKQLFEKKKVVALRDYSGGLNSAFSPFQLKDNEVADIQNFHYDERGTLRKRTGFTKLYAAAFADGPVRGLHNYRREDGTSRLIIGADDKLFSDLPNFLQVWDAAADWTQSGTELQFCAAANVGALTVTSGDVAHTAEPLSALGNMELGGADSELGGTTKLPNAEWRSQTVDISAITDKTTGRVTKQLTVPSGSTITLQTRYSTDGVTWGSWTALGAGDTVQGVGTNTKLQIRAQFTSTSALRGSVQKLQITFDQSSTPTSFATGLSTSARYSFTTQNDLLVIVNGENVDKKWDATTFADLGGSPPTAKYVIVHKNRCFLAGNSSNRSRLYFSDLDNPESWPALNFIDVGRGDGDPMTGFGIVLDSLAVFKENSVWVLNGDAPSNFVLRRMTDDGGALDMHTLAVVRNTIGFLSRDGVRFFDGLRSALASEKIEPSLDAANQKQLSLGAAIVHDGKYYLSLPEAASLKNDVTFVFDSLRTAWTIYRGMKAAEWVVWRKFGEDKLVFGSADTGQVYEMDASKTDDGAAITAYFVTKAIAPSGPEALNLFRSVLITGGDPDGANVSVSVSLAKNLGAFGTAQTVQMNPVSGEKLNVEKVIPSVGGVSLARALQVKVQHTDTATGLDIRAIAVQYVPKSVREST